MAEGPIARADARAPHSPCSRAPQCITSPPKPSFARSDRGQLEDLLGATSPGAPRHTALDCWACHQSIRGPRSKYGTYTATVVRGAHFMQAVDREYEMPINGLLDRMRKRADGEPVLRTEGLLEDHALADVDAAVFIYDKLGRLTALGTLVHDELSSTEGLRVYELEHVFKDRTMRKQAFPLIVPLLREQVIAHTAAAVQDGTCVAGTRVEWRTFAIEKTLSEYYHRLGFVHAGACYKDTDSGKVPCDPDDPDVGLRLGVYPMPSAVDAAPDSTAMDVDGLGATSPTDPGAESDTATPPRADEGGLGAAAPPTEGAAAVESPMDLIARMQSSGASCDRVEGAPRARHAAGDGRRQGAYAAVDQSAYIPLHYPPKQSEAGGRPDVYPDKNGQPDTFEYVNPRSLQYNLMKYGTVAIQAR